MWLESAKRQSLLETEDSTYHIDAYTLHALILQRCMTRSVSVAGYTLGYDFLRQPV